MSSNALFMQIDQKQNNRQRYISPTFMSNALFYPQYANQSNPHVQPVTNLREKYEEGSKRQSNYYKQPDKSPIQMSLQPSQVQTPKKEQQEEREKSVSQASVYTPIKNHQPCTPSSKSVTSKKSHHSIVSHKEYADQQKSHTPSQKSSISMISELICPNCFNKELATEKKNAQTTQRLKEQQALLEQTNRFNKEQQAEKQFQQKLKEMQKEQLQKEYELFQKKKMQDQEIREKDKMNYRQQDNSEENQSQQKTQKKEYNRLPNQDGTKYQLQEKDMQRRSSKSPSVNATAVFRIGDESETQKFNMIRKEQERRFIMEQRDAKIQQREAERKQQKEAETQMQRKLLQQIQEEIEMEKDRERRKKQCQQKQFQDYLAKAVQDNQSIKERQRQMENRYKDWAQQMDQVCVQREVQERNASELKRKQLIQDLSDQIEEKKQLERQKKQRENEMDMSRIETNKNYQYLTKQIETPDLRQCDECQSVFKKEYLTKIKKAKNK